MPAVLHIASGGVLSTDDDSDPIIPPREFADAAGLKAAFKDRSGAEEALGPFYFVISHMAPEVWLVSMVMAVSKTVQAANARDFVAYVRANPGKVTYASQGNGSTSHLSAQMFATMAGVDLVHVPYKGEGPALIDITAGRVDIFIGNIAAALRFRQSGQVKFLGLAGKNRSPVAPDVPDAAEIGLPNLIASAWFAVVAPPGTPDAIAQKINADTVAALKLADVRAKFLEQGAEPQGDTTAATAAFIKDEEARWREVIKSANVTLE